MNNVYEKNGQWYFYDETGDEYGPYKSMELACANSWLYGHWHNTGEAHHIVEGYRSRPDEKPKDRGLHRNS